MQEFKTEKAIWYIDFTRSGESFRLSLDKWLTMEDQSNWHNRQNIRSNCKLSQKSSMYVEIGEYQSEDFKTDIGVPQGAVLSPLLFIIFVSEMLNGIDVDKFKFADDGNLLISASSTTELHKRTDAALLKFVQWGTKWRLKMNVNKTILVPINVEIKRPKISEVRNRNCEKFWKALKYLV